MQKLLGNDKLLSQLQSAARENRLAHAYLLCGQRGRGKKTLANILSQMILCEQNGCDTCRTCQKLQKGIHPDLIHIHGVTKTGSYSVDQIRQLRQDAMVYPNEAAKKVYILHDAEKMSPAAQDAFLKILEEPPQFVVFILVCNEENKLLSTILSRVIRLAPVLPEQQEVLPWLQQQSGADVTLAKTALDVAAGNPGRALELLQDNEMENKIKQCEQFCTMLLTRPHYELAAMSHKLAADKNDFMTFLSMLILYFRDILMYKTVGERALIFGDSIRNISPYLARFTTQGVVNTICELQRLCTYTQQPISALLLEMRLVTLLKEELL